MKEFMEFIVLWGKRYIYTLEYPLGFFLEALGEPATRRPWFWVYDIVITLIIFSIVSGTLGLFKKLYKFFRKRSDFIDRDDYDAYVRKRGQKFSDTLDAVHNPISTIEPLIAAKQYDRVARIYSSLNQPSDAAKYFRKAKDRKNEAIELAKCGETIRAAKLLMREGDYATAVRFFEDQGDYAQAATAYTYMGQHNDAAEAFLMAEKPLKAAKAFLNYFETTDASPNEQLRIAQSCYNMLEEERDTGKIKADLEMKLMIQLAPRFETSMWFYLAGTTYYQAEKYSDAIRVLRLVPPGDPNKIQAEALLKKCYAEKLTSNDQA